MTSSPPVCDYEGSDYRTRFWEGQGRGYEDQVERLALRRLMPPAGDTLLEVGAGFGRLADEYRGYRRVVLFDYSRSLLREAQEHLAPAGDHNTEFIFVAGNWYQMPFVDGLIETLVQVRTLHHAADVPALFTQLARIGRPDGHYILEFANKKNLKALLRYWTGRQSWSPLAPEPVEFVALNFDFHPRWIREQLTAAGFQPEATRTVSHFRLELLKRIVPLRLLVALDRTLQPSFIRSKHPAGGPMAAPGSFFACPECQTPLGDVLSAGQDARLDCDGCGRCWSMKNGLYDFKEPVE